MYRIFAHYDYFLSCLCGRTLLTIVTKLLIPLALHHKSLKYPFYYRVCKSLFLLLRKRALEKGLKT